MTCESPCISKSEYLRVLCLAFAHLAVDVGDKLRQARCQISDGKGACGPLVRPKRLSQGQLRNAPLRSPLSSTLQM